MKARDIRTDHEASLKMRPFILLLTVVLLLVSALAWATPTPYYRACCIDEPEKHGCSISTWHLTEKEANRAGAEHAERTSGHRWFVEVVTR